MPEPSASHRLRIGRYAEQNRIYLLTANTVDREPVFRDYTLGRMVVQQFKQAQFQGFADSLAFVVMPDHFHWLIQLQKGTLSQLMCQAKSLSTRSIMHRVAERAAFGNRAFMIMLCVVRKTW